MDARTIDTQYKETVDTPLIMSLIDRIKDLNNNTVEPLSEILNKNPKQVEELDKLEAIRLFEGIIPISIFEKDPSIAYSIFNDTSITLEEFIDKISNSDEATIVKYKENLQNMIVKDHIVRVDTNLLYPFDKDNQASRVREITINASAKNYASIAFEIYSKLMEENVPFLMDIRLPRDLKKGYMDPIKIDSTSKNFDKILSIVSEILEKNKDLILPPSPLYASIDGLIGYTAVQPTTHSEDGFKRTIPMNYVLDVLSKTIDETLRDFRHNYPNVVIDNNNTWAGKMFNLNLIETKYPDVYMTFLNNVLSYIDTCKDVIDVKNLFTIPSMTLYASDIQKLDDRLESTTSMISEDTLDDDIKPAPSKADATSDFGVFAPSWLNEEATKKAEAAFNDLGVETKEKPVEPETLDSNVQTPVQTDLGVFAPSWLNEEATKKAEEAFNDLSVEEKEQPVEVETLDSNVQVPVQTDLGVFGPSWMQEQAQSIAEAKLDDAGIVDQPQEEIDNVNTQTVEANNAVSKQTAIHNEYLKMADNDEEKEPIGTVTQEPVEEQPTTTVTEEFVPVIPSLDDLADNKEEEEPVVDEEPAEATVVDEIPQEVTPEVQVEKVPVETPVVPSEVEQEQAGIDVSNFEDLLTESAPVINEEQKELQVIDVNKPKENLQEDINKVNEQANETVAEVKEETQGNNIPNLEDLKIEPAPVIEEEQKELQVIDVNRPQETVQTQEEVDDEEENKMFNTGAYQLNEIKTTSLNDSEVTSVVTAPPRGATMDPQEMALTLGAFQDCLSVDDALTDITNENGEKVTIIDYLKSHHAEELLNKTIDTNDTPNMSGKDYIKLILVPLLKQGRQYDQINTVQIVEMAEQQPQKVEAKKQGFFKGLFHRK